MLSDARQRKLLCSYFIDVILFDVSDFIDVDSTCIVDGRHCTILCFSALSTKYIGVGHSLASEKC